jgi:hypothetical protein
MLWCAPTLASIAASLLTSGWGQAIDFEEVPCDQAEVRIYTAPVAQLEAGGRTWWRQGTSESHGIVWQTGDIYIGEDQSLLATWLAINHEMGHVIFQSDDHTSGVMDGTSLYPSKAELARARETSYALRGEGV